MKPAVDASLGAWRNRVRWLWLTGCLLVAGWLAVLAVSPDAEQIAARQAAAGRPAVGVGSASVPAVTKPIEKFGVGDRVLGRNPDRTDVCDDSLTGGGVLRIEAKNYKQWLTQGEMRVKQEVKLTREFRR